MVKKSILKQQNFTFTSESVCAGHPDKICDRISDAILDEVLIQDRNGRVAVETIAGHNKLFVIGELSTKAEIDIEKIARIQIKELGYTHKKYNFSAKSPVEILVHKQSEEIAQGVDLQGAGDQGMMFGYACTQTKELMPLPIMLSHRFAEKIDTVRTDGTLAYLHPDGKTQVTVGFKNHRPTEIKHVVVAVPHSEKVKLSQVKRDIYKYVVKPVLDAYGFKFSREEIILNGTGSWHIGGPSSDAGLTGRKIVVDTYGGWARVGGGCFSGKDPTKVDRSGAYAARFLAKNIVAKELAAECEVRLAYFIGAKKPLMEEIETFGTEKVSRKEIKEYAGKILDTSVSGIIDGLNLSRPIYKKTSSYGHFGREGFPWEEIV